MNCGACPRHGLDLALLWLWCRPGAAAPIPPLAWELPYAAGTALKKKFKKKKKKRKKLKESVHSFGMAFSKKHINKSIGDKLETSIDSERSSVFAGEEIKFP